ncbi:MAG: DUF4388 domain-containing protein [Deltaproteobacteria bacterium]|nr:DUF4388 domain-containing protein [Deltaproteobacteria bacterium]
MALEGSIKDFGVADILQLIAQQQKSGVLHIDRNGTMAEVTFAGGRIVETRITDRKVREPLGEILLRAKQISPDALQSALAKQNDTYEALGQILLKSGVVGKEVLEKALMFQIYETFYDILQWRSGSYSFVPESVTVEHDLSFIPALETVLLDVFRMIDEWPDVLRVILSLETVFEHAAEAPEPLNWDQDERLVYELVDGSRSVKQIAAESLLGTFLVGKTLGTLLEQGIIGKAEKQSAPAQAGGGDRLRKAVGFISYGVGICIVAVLLMLSPTLPETVLPLFHGAQYNASYVQRYNEYRSIRRLTTAVESYWFVYGTYPQTVQALAKSHLLDAKELRRIEAYSIGYERKGDRYSIVRPDSPDGNIPIRSGQAFDRSRKPE